MNLVRKCLLFYDGQNYWQLQIPLTITMTQEFINTYLNVVCLTGWVIKNVEYMGEAMGPGQWKCSWPLGEAGHLYLWKPLATPFFSHNGMWAPDLAFKALHNLTSLLAHPHPDPLVQAAGLPTVLKTLPASSLGIGSSGTIHVFSIYLKLFIFLVTQLFKADISVKRSCNSYQAVKWFYFPQWPSIYLKVKFLKMLNVYQSPPALSASATLSSSLFLKQS